MMPGRVSETRAEGNVSGASPASDALTVVRPVRAGQRPYVLVGSAGFFAGFAAGWLIGTSNHLVYAVPYAVLAAVEVWSSVAIGLYYWSYRPTSRPDTLLVAYGFTSAAIGLQGSSIPLVATLGVLAEVPGLILILWLILEYQGERLGDSGRWILASWGILAPALYGPWLLLHPTVVTPTALGACRANCPANPLSIGGAADRLAPLLSRLPNAWRIGAFVLLAVVFLRYLPTLRRSVAERNVMLPVLAIFSIWLLGSTVYGAVQLTDRQSQVVFWALYHGRAIFPLSFLAGLLAAEMFSVSSLRTVIRHLDSGSRPNEEATLADALSDPAIKLAFWIPASDQFVDADGVRVSPPAANSGRVMTEFRRGGQLIGGIISDAAIGRHPELLESAARVVSIAVDNRRLEGDLKTTRGYLSSSRAESAAATENQRRRIERDLHDSLQQELLAVDMRVQVARNLTQDVALRDRLAGISEDLALARQNVRDIARGLRPANILAQGLTPPLADAAQRAPIPVVFRSSGVGRYPAEVEEAIYFCCLEALQNAEKHAGPDANATIDIIGSDDALSFTVRDTGRGFDQTRAHGQGLRNMFERMNGIGGWLSIDSRVGRGTTISGGITLGTDRPRGQRDERS
jgi:signal transduction histidine kinase